MRLAALLFCCVLALAACGKKGDPEPLQPDTFPKQYPAPEPLSGANKNAPPLAAPQPQPFDQPQQPYDPLNQQLIP